MVITGVTAPCHDEQYCRIWLVETTPYTACRGR